MAEERLYTIPLRGKWVKKTRILRTKKAVNTVKEFVKRHTKASDVRISPKLNDVLWSGGAKKPPAKVQAKITIDGNTAWARLPNETEAKGEEKKKGAIESLKERVAGKEQPEKKEAEKPAAKDEAETEKPEPAKG